MPTPTVCTPFLVPYPSHPALAPQPQRPVRRRPDMQQGRALEILGHAIEYLVDSRLFLSEEPVMPVETDALQVLSRCSREVFATCEEIVPIHQRFRQWASDRLKAGVLHPRRI